MRKRSLAKSWRPGRKRAFRLLDDAGAATAEVLLGPDASLPTGGVALQTDFVSGGEFVLAEAADPTRSVQLARDYHREARGRLGPAALDLTPGDPWLPIEPALEDV